MRKKLIGTLALMLGVTLLTSAVMTPYNIVATETEEGQADESGDKISENLPVESEEEGLTSETSSEDDAELFDTDTSDAELSTSDTNESEALQSTEDVLVVDEKGAQSGAVEMYRIYNPNSGEHFYTGSVAERNHLLTLGWRYEGIGWIAPAASSVPVYRLYNPNAGDHHYTTSVAERDWLIPKGWRYEGIGWYSDEQQTYPLYRQYNPNARTGTHNYTISSGENSHLVSLGWRYEGIAWYGMSDPDPRPSNPVTIYNKIDYSSIYDFNWYASANGLSIYNDATAIEHFVKNALKNKRAGKASYSQSDYNNLRENTYPGAAVLDVIGWNLTAAYNWAAGMRWEKTVIDPNLGTRWYYNYGKDHYYGNCYVMAGSFCQLARTLGYNANQMSGNVKSRGGRLTPHSWVVIDGYVYDPDATSELKLNAFRVSYGQSGTLSYVPGTYMR